MMPIFCVGRFERTLLRRIRLLMAAMPPIQCDIVRALVAGDPRVDILAESLPETDLATAVKVLHADVVMTRAWSDPAAPEALLRHNPGLRVLTLTDGGRVGYLDRLVVQRTVLTDVSPEELIDAVLGGGRFGEGGEQDAS